MCTYTYTFFFKVCLLPKYVTLTKRQIKEMAMTSHIPALLLVVSFLENSTMKGNHLTLTMGELDNQ